MIPAEAKPYLAGTSRRNVEIGKRLNEAFNRGEVETGLAHFSPEAELRDLLNAPGQDPVVRGTDRIREVLFLWTSVFDELQVEVSEWIEAGDSLVVHAHWRGHGDASGISVDSDQFDLYEFEQGAIHRATLGFRSKEEALEVAGVGR